MSLNTIDKVDLAIHSNPSAAESGKLDGERSDFNPAPIFLFPDGGFQAWKTVLGAFIVQFVTFGYVNSFGVFNDFYVREYLNNKTSSDIGWIGSVQLFITLSSAIVTGRMFDRGYFHHLMISGCFIFILCIFMLSLSHEHQYYQVFLAHGLGVGLGTGLTYLPSLAITAHYFETKRAWTIGIISAGASVGSVVHPIMLNKLFGSLGFHNAVRANAGLCVGLLVIANLLMRTRLPPRESGMFIPVREFARDVPYIFSIIGGFLVLVALFFPIFFIQLDDVVHGINPNFAFYSVSTLQAAGFFGRVLPQLSLSYIGLFNLLLICLTADTILVFCMIAVKTIAGTVVFAILYGFFSGATVSLVPSVFATFAKNYSEVGVRMGIAIFIGGFGGLVGLPITAALLSSDFIWWRPAVFSGVILAAGTLAFYISRLGIVRKKGTQKV